MGAKNEFLKKLQIARDVGYQEGFEIAKKIMRQISLDATTISLGELGCTPEFLHDFKSEYEKTEYDIAMEIIEDQKNVTDGKGKKVEEHDLWKEKIDRKIKEFVMPEDFCSYDERYGIEW